MHVLIICEYPSFPDIDCWKEGDDHATRIKDTLEYIMCNWASFEANKEQIYTHDSNCMQNISLYIIFPFSDAVRFCFGEIINQELQEFTLAWNHHRIRKSNMAETPAGVPDILFYMPEGSGY